MENGRWKKMKLMWLKPWKGRTRHLEGDWSKCKNVATWELSKHSQDETRKGETILTTHSQIEYSNFTLKFNVFLQEHSTSIYSVKGLKLKWENSNETHLNLAPIPSHKGGVTWFLTLEPSKSTSTPSFYVTWKVWLIFVHWHPLFLYLHLLFMF